MTSPGHAPRAPDAILQSNSSVEVRYPGLEDLREHLKGEMTNFAKTLLLQLQEMFERQEKAMSQHVRSVEGLLERQERQPKSPVLGVNEAKVNDFLSLALDSRRMDLSPSAAKTLTYSPSQVRNSSEAGDEPAAEPAAVPPAPARRLHGDSKESLSKERAFTSLASSLVLDVANSSRSCEASAMTSGLATAGLEDSATLAKAFPKSVTLSHIRLTTEKTFEIEKCRTAVPDFVWRFISPWVHWWYNLEEPERTGRLATMVRHRAFGLVCEFVIAANSAIVVYLVNSEAQTLEENSSRVVWALNLVFVAFYVLEMALRIAVHRWWFFCNQMCGWNTFDFSLVTLAVVDVVIEEIFAEGYVDVGHMRVIRSLRLMRAAKILRIFRLMRVFSELRLLLSSVLASLVSLFWGLVMLVFMFFIFGLIFVQGATTTRINAANNPEAAIDPTLLAGLEYNWAATERAMLVLFASVTGGNDWVVYYEQIAATGFMNTNLFIFFIAFAQFALLNILTGIFVEHALKLAEPDRETAAFLRRKEELQDTQELRSLCMAMDPDRTGLVSEDYFLEHIKQEQFKARLALLGLDIKQAAVFCDVIFTEFGAKEVEIEAFVSAAMRLKGLATSLDLQALLFGTKMIYDKLSLLQEQVDRSAVPARV